MSDIIIRPLRAEDAESVLLIMNAPGVRWGTMQTGVTTITEQRKHIEERVDDPNRISLGAEVTGAIVGIVSLRLSANPRLRHVAGFGITVHDDYTGRRIGTALIAAILDLADNWLNLHRVELDVNVDNMAAIHLYEKFGFAREGVRRDLVFRAGCYVDCYHMARIRPQFVAKTSVREQ